MFRCQRRPGWAGLFNHWRSFKYMALGYGIKSPRSPNVQRFGCDIPTISREYFEEFWPCYTQNSTVGSKIFDVQLTSFTNPTTHLSHIPEYTIQNRNVPISVLNGALWDMGMCIVRFVNMVYSDVRFLWFIVIFGLCTSTLVFGFTVQLNSIQLPMH